MSRLKEKMEKKKRPLHIMLGLEQLVLEKPYKLVFIVGLCICFWGAWKWKDVLFFEKMNIPNLFTPFFEYVVPAVMLLFFLAILVAVIEYIGDKTANEHEIEMENVFKEEKTEGMLPLMCSQRKKENGIYEECFYTYIPPYRWNEKREELQSSLKITLLREGIKLGGKKRNNPRKIVLYYRKGYDNSDKKPLNDEV